MRMNPNRQLRDRHADQCTRRSLWTQRAMGQLEFVDAYADAQETRKPDEAKRCRKLAAQARKLVEDVLDAGQLDKLPQAVRDAEAILAPLAETAKSFTVHCVGHGHIDMNWMWSWPETVADTNDTFETVLKLMDEFPDFCYSQSQASVYEIARQHNPQQFERIKQRVAEGRWEVAAAQWVEGDNNLPLGEALAHHLLYTRRFVQEHFGIAPEDQPLDWEPDTFGHAAMIPAVLSRGAVKYYYMCRGGNWEKPPLFWWQAPDGSRVLVNLETTWYNDHIEPHIIPPLLRFYDATGLREWMHVYGVGDHGGGPTRRDIAWAHEMDAWPIFPNVKLTTTRDYYRHVEANADDLPVIKGELNFEFTGCYSSQSEVKKTNRYGELYCMEVQSLAALAWRGVGRDYPTEAIREAWIKVLFGHFHDILPGSGVRGTREYHLGQFQQVAATTGIIRTESLRRLADAIDTSFADRGEPEACPLLVHKGMGGGAACGSDDGSISLAGHMTDAGGAFVAFNPTARPRKETLRLILWDPADTLAGQDIEGLRFVAIDADGKETPCQVLDTQPNWWAHARAEIAVPVEVPAMGYRAWTIEPVEPKRRWTDWGTFHYKDPNVLPDELAGAQAGVSMDSGVHNAELQPHSKTATLENQHVRAVIDRATASVVSLVDKASGRDVIDPDSPARLEYVLESPRGMSSWILGDPISVSPLQVRSIQTLHDGLHLVGLRAELEINASRVTADFLLSTHQRWLDVRVALDPWLEVGGEGKGIPSLRFAAGTSLAKARATCEIPYGTITRDLNGGEEVPAIRFFDATGKLGQAAAGLTMFNDSKYGHSLDGATMRMTLIRSSYAPDKLPELGDHVMRLGLMPHDGTLKAAELIETAAEFSQPLRVVTTGAHAGALPAQASALSIKGAGVVLAGLKKAEDEEALILRLVETAGKAATAEVKLDKAWLGKVTDAVECDLLERPLEKNTAKATPGGLSVKLSKYGIATVKVTLG